MSDVKCARCDKPATRAFCLPGEPWQPYCGPEHGPGVYQPDGDQPIEEVRWPFRLHAKSATTEPTAAELIAFVQSRMADACALAAYHTVCEPPDLVVAARADADANRYAAIVIRLAQADRMERAITAFLAKWEVAEPAINSLTIIAHIHGAGYNGPVLTFELDALRAALDSGLCCMSRHANAVPPWTCDCPCHADAPTEGT